MSKNVLTTIKGVMYIYSLGDFSQRNETFIFNKLFVIV